jgi:hypothetical protein
MISPAYKVSAVVLLILMILSCDHELTQRQFMVTILLGIWSLIDKKGNQ